MNHTELNHEKVNTLEQQIQLLNEQVKQLTEQVNIIQSTKSKGWMNFKEACIYIGVSHNTFTKFRSLGLKTCEVDGIKRVSKKDIDEFFNKHIN